MNRNTILLDLHVQKDLFAPGGALYTEDADVATANVYRLFHWARVAEAPVLSMKLLARPGHHGPFALEPHCVEDSGGDAKLPRTLLSRRINLGLAHTADLPRDLLENFQQIVFETRDDDPFHHQKFERFIAELDGPRTFVICGASIAHGVKQAVLGLRRQGHSTLIAADAIVNLPDADAEMAWLQVVAKGALLMPTSEFLHEHAAREPRRRRAGSAVAS